MKCQFILRNHLNYQSVQGVVYWITNYQCSEIYIIVLWKSMRYIYKWMEWIKYICILILFWILSLWEISRQLLQPLTTSVLKQRNYVYLSLPESYIYLSLQEIIYIWVTIEVIYQAYIWVLLTKMWVANFIVYTILFVLTNGVDPCQQNKFYFEKGNTI